MPLGVIVVEDDAVLREILSLHLSREGYAVRSVGSGDLALAACRENRPDVVVLDISLPGASGLEVCATLRATCKPSPGVVIVTARASEADVLLGFDAGADDYVLKPCRPREIVARVAALARRLLPPNEQGVLSRGRLTLDLGAMSAAVDAKRLDLTPTELAGTVQSRRALLSTVFHSGHEGYARNVDCHVARLRRKLEAAGLVPAPIETVHGTGYRFVIYP